MAGGLRWLTLSPAFYHTCGINATGAIGCCGYNYDGQLGTGGTNTTPETTPVNESLHKTWLAVSSGVTYTVAIEKVSSEDITGQSYGCGLEQFGR